MTTLYMIAWCNGNTLRHRTVIHAKLYGHRLYALALARSLNVGERMGGRWYVVKGELDRRAVVG